MELRIGLYAFFAYTLSGMGYFTVGLVVLETRWPGMTAGANKEWPFSILLVATALCYFTGLLLDPVARVVFRIVYRRSSRELAICMIAKHNPEASALTRTYWPLLLAELHLARESLVEHADVYKAACILLRNLGAAASVGAPAVLSGLFQPGSNSWTLLIGGSLAAAAALALVESRKFDCWFHASLCERLLVLRAQNASVQMAAVAAADLPIAGDAAKQVTGSTTANTSLQPTDAGAVLSVRG